MEEKQTNSENGKKFRMTKQISQKASFEPHTKDNYCAGRKSMHINMQIHTQKVEYKISSIQIHIYHYAIYYRVFEFLLLVPLKSKSGHMQIEQVQIQGKYVQKNNNFKEKGEEKAK